MSPTLQKIIKRDGRIARFDVSKIQNAITKALIATGEGDERHGAKIAAKVGQMLDRTYLQKKRIPNIEEIQDTVERVLMILDFEKSAKAYILYREQHRKMREAKESIYEALDLIDNYIREEDWKVKENSNMGYSLQGMNNFISSAVSSKYWMDRVYTPKIKKAHESGDFHIHDLQLIAAYCCGWDLHGLLRAGFGGVPGKVTSGPAKHLRSALGQMVNFIYTLQGEANGAQAFSNFDTLLAPFIRFDSLRYHDVKQAIQEFVFNMNVPTRVGFQTPFSNITLDLSMPSTYKDEAVIIGGKPQQVKYGEFQEEMNMINQAFCEVMSAGDSAGRVFSFPIPTINVTKDFDWDNPGFEPIWQMTARYGTPYFANFINSDMNPEDARSMCCRLRLDNRELYKRGGGLFGANPLTGSIGVVTINMPRLGYLSVNKQEFLERLDKLMDIAKESLEIKREFIERLTNIGLYPFSRLALADIKKRRNSYWANHFSTIGLLGLNEALLNLIGRDIATSEGRKLASEILIHMRDRMIKYQKETGNMYNLEATPAEGTSYRLARLDREYHPDIIFANHAKVAEGEAEPYYTNSSQLPVGHTDDIFTAFRLQDELQTKYTGGTVLHGFIGEQIKDPQVVKKLVRTLASEFHLPYFTLTPTFSICPVHGYLNGEHMQCPKCVLTKKEAEVIKI